MGSGVSGGWIARRFQLDVVKFQGSSIVDAVLGMSGRDGLEGGLQILALGVKDNDLSRIEAWVGSRARGWRATSLTASSCAPFGPKRERR